MFEHILRLLYSLFVTIRQFLNITVLCLLMCIFITSALSSNVLALMSLFWMDSIKCYWLSGNDLVERFHDQFLPMRVTQDASLSTANSTIIRMPLSSKCLKELEAGSNRVKQIFDRFTQNPSSTLLFLRSIIQVRIICDRLSACCHKHDLFKSSSSKGNLVWFWFLVSTLIIGYFTGTSFWNHIIM